jgi:hypothetical protein
MLLHLTHLKPHEKRGGGAVGVVVFPGGEFVLFGFPVSPIGGKV